MGLERLESEVCVVAGKNDGVSAVHCRSIRSHELIKVVGQRLPSFPEGGRSILFAAKVGIDLLGY